MILSVKDMPPLPLHLESREDFHQNLISFEGGQDSSAGQISGHSSHAFSRKCPQTIKFDQFHYVKVALKGGKSTDCDQNLISSEGGHDTSVNKISSHSSMPSPEHAQKHQIWPVSLSQSGAKTRKINRPWQKFSQFWRWPKGRHSQTTPSAPSHPLRYPRTGVGPTHLCLLAD